MRTAPVQPTPMLAGSLTGCTVREVRRERLTDEVGRTMYVEPIALEANSRGDVMLAGARNFLFEQSPEGTWRIAGEAGDSILGAFLPRTGGVRTVPSPIPTGLLGTVRVAARDDGAWDAVFAELRPGTRDIGTDSVARLWHGVFDGSRWVSLNSLPLPSVGYLRIYGASELLRYGNSLAWAMPIEILQQLNRVVVFERHHDRWTFEVVPTPGGASPALAHSDALGLVLAVVHPDRTLPRDRNSLFLYARQPTWRILRKVVPSNEGQVYAPQITPAPEGILLSWIAEVPSVDVGRWEARAMLGRLEREQPVITFDAALIRSGSAVVPLMLTGGGRLWVLDHLLPSGSEREIRLASDSSGTPVSLGRIPNPFATGFVAAAPAPSELLIAGGTHNAAQKLVSTWLLWLTLECREPRS